MDRPISFATFNLLNLARAGQVTYRDETPPTAGAVDTKVRWIAAKLREINADVWGFQEVWAADVLARCFDEAGLDYEFVARDGPVDNVQVALAARRGLLRPGGSWVEGFPPEVVLRKAPATDAPPEDIRVAINNFSRPVLMATVEPGILVMVAHLKSKRPTELDAADRARPDVQPHAGTLGRALSQIRRTAEAAALRVLLANRITGQGTPAVVLGDLNDNERAVSTGLITNEPRYVLSPGGGAGAAADVNMYSTADLQKFRSLKDVTYSYIFNDQVEILDHILVSEEFYDASRFRRWSFNGLRIWNDHLGPSRPAGATDHAILKASFRPLPATPAPQPPAPPAPPEPPVPPAPPPSPDTPVESPPGP